MDASHRPRTLGALKASGHRPQSVRAEMRANFVRRLSSGEPILPGIIEVVRGKMKAKKAE